MKWADGRERSAEQEEFLLAKCRLFAIATAAEGKRERDRLEFENARMRAELLRKMATERPRKAA